jgi:hypothetical protein
VTDRSRLLVLLARREALRARAAAVAAAAAQARADVAAELAKRLSAVLHEAGPAGSRPAADLQRRHRLMLDIASEHERQRDQIRTETARAAVQRQALEHHTQRRTKLEDAANEGRARDAAEQEARAMSLLPERIRRR